MGFRANYAVYVHDGTDAYTIRPSKAQALFWKGARHPVKRVRHPGIKANPFLRKAVDQSNVSIRRNFTEAVEETLAQIGKDSK